MSTGIKGLKLFWALVRQLHGRARTYPVARGKIVVAHLRGLVSQPLALACVSYTSWSLNGLFSDRYHPVLLFYAFAYDCVVFACLLLSFTESWHHSDGLIPCMTLLRLGRLLLPLCRGYSSGFVAATLPSAVLAVNDLNLTNDNTWRLAVAWPWRQP